jgi:hypothetical protein
MINKIEWIPVSKEAELVVPVPKPAKSYIPQWYKNITPLKNPQFSSTGEVLNKNIKSCMPFLDALTSGYIQESWTDIYVEVLENEVRYNYSVGPDIMSHRGDSSEFKIGDMFYPTEFIWKEQWLPKLPKGYSALYTSPLNLFSLPFKSLDAIIDCDNYYHEYNGQYPFYIYKGFSGIIPAGTPMFQIIPIKRDSWKSNPCIFDENKNKKLQHEIKKIFFNSYKQQFWQKKEFN